MRLSRAVALSFVLIATFASAIAAGRYSADAVMEARLLLDIAITREKSGVAQPWELAAARYNLLDMQYRAKAISEDAFCKSAKPQLEIAVAGLVIGDEQSDEKRKWAAAIAAMDSNRAKCRQAGAAADILLFDAGNYAASALTLEQAQTLMTRIDAQHDQYIVGDLDVSQAKYRLVLAEVRAGKIDHAGYCASALPILHKIDDLLVRRLQEGAGSVAEVLAGSRPLHATVAECGGVSRP